MKKPVILIIEDDPDGAQSVVEAIRDADMDPMLATTGKAGLETFQRVTPDVVLTDLVLPDIDGIQVLSSIRRRNPMIPVIVMTAYGSVESSVQAMRAGAYDYIPKPLDLDDIQSKVCRAVETVRLRTRVEQLSQSVQERFSARNMIAVSPAMQDVLRQIESLADTQATVLIEGESGTGKEVVARALHAESRRAPHAFVAVNCGALTETLLESELFGHEKGAFTGATHQYPGAFERADGGTLFLDEIGDAPSAVQVKLLRALEDREIRRVGGRQTFTVDVRFLSATHHDLAELVADGKFREDLFYRIHVVKISLPPLRQRREDIRPLVDRFVAEACERHGRSIARVMPDFYTALEAQPWPGNVRQLRNMIETAVLLAPGDMLEANVLPPMSSTVGTTGAFVIPDAMTLAQIEREALTQALKRHQGNRTLCAERLGISRRTIQRKIKEHNLPFSAN